LIVQRFTAKRIIESISEQMKNKICKHVKSICGKLSILIDESTTLSTKTTLIVYLKCEFAKDSDPKFMFFDLIEIPGKKKAQSLI